MDESLSDFKEKKAGYTGPKKPQKPVVKKPKPKKTLKCIKGQKDIRIALESKKNGLLAYAEEFDKVCRKSGIDVDTEQLQIAIALSKSVQSTEVDDNNLDSQPISSQERSKRIRTTLKEYGFVVPEGKITNKRQRKKAKKNYKLILTTEQEKQQIISDKYTQLLFENVCESTVIEDKNHSADKSYYKLATNISYLSMKNNDVLYVENLLERSYSNGCLLRDWSNIPGRSLSPKACVTVKMNFSEIECSQEELDIVLSGTLKSARSIVQNKIKAHNNESLTVIDSAKSDEHSNVQENIKNNKNESFEKNDIINNESNKIDDGYTSCLTTSDRVRSYSPDIFDDEVSAVHDTTANNSNSINCNSAKKIVMDLTQDYCYERNSSKTLETCLSGKEDVTDLAEGDKSSNQLKENNDMITDLTKVNYARHKNHATTGNNTKTASQSSTNFTKRHSNDFMEITECVVSSGLDPYTNNAKTNVSPIKNTATRMTYDFMEITECVSKPLPNSGNIVDNIDLTQNLDNDENLVEATTSVANVVHEIIDVSQSSDSDEELPFVQMSSSNNHSLDDTILLDNDEIMIKTNPIRSSVCEIDIENVDDIMEGNANSKDITESRSSPSNRGNKSGSQNAFDEFVYNHSDDDSSNLRNNIELIQSDSKTSNACDEVEVDLTQSSDSLDSTKETTKKSTVYTPAKVSHGKKDDVSVDYDELFDDIAKADAEESSKHGHSSHKSVSYDDNEKTSESRSQNSEVFDISDKEFEYSINKSKNFFPGNVNFGEMSIMENVPRLGIGNRNSNIKQFDNNRSMNRSLSDSYLPLVDIKKHLTMVKKNGFRKDFGDKDRKKNESLLDENQDNEALPCKAFAKENTFTADTPTNNKYIVKTDQVTPMLDYASMSTPDRNRELDRYGLKPFKRKRAIQLLTHLYNQTHPIVESCPEGLPSPSKKKRYSSQPSPTKLMMSPKKTFKSPNKSLRSPGKCLKSPNKSLRSPGKCLKSPSKSLKSSDVILKSPNKCSQNELMPEFYEDDNVYEVTSEFPVIKDISCSEEDWIFQKREKAKLHSCRVPLHIALHNYVSCRRKLQEAILKYEPVNIDVIHKQLVACGHRYDPKDLLKYMDKKCITVKTADNNARNRR